MNIENYIEGKYRELKSMINIEYEDLYREIAHPKLREIFTTLHYLIISGYMSMNQRLPTGDDTAHFWAEQSRELIKAIEIATGLQRTLKSSEFAFDMDQYYYDLIEKSQQFLSNSGGSTIPEHMEKVELYFTIPIFRPYNSISIKRATVTTHYKLTTIGEGSYANVFKFKDDFYQKMFVLKRAKKNLDVKEIERFKREFEEMRDLYSPYIVEVYCYDEKENEYIMEMMDGTIHKYIMENNNKLLPSQRKNICNQILRAFKYIHEKGRLHRDISPKNILFKQYDDVLVIKVADFGLVKVPDSTLTTINTEFKGYFNDPALVVEGFATYKLVHETYALTRLMYFILTGKTNIDKTDNFPLRDFVAKGLSSSKEKRFQSINELINCFQKLNLE